jgi:hypothetical protein
MKRQFVVYAGKDCHTGSLRQCQQVFKDYRAALAQKGLGARSMLVNDGLVVIKSGDTVGHFSYNGRFWRTDFLGNRV